MLEYMDWSAHLFHERIQLNSDGQAIVPDRPGLGVTLDEDLVAARTIA